MFKRMVTAVPEPKRSPVPLYLAGALWVLYALFSPVYQYPDFIVLAVLGWLFFLIVYLVIPSRKKKEEQLLAEQQAYQLSLPEVQANMAASSYKEFLQAVRVFKPVLFLRDPILSAHVTELEKNLQDAIDELQERQAGAEEFTFFTDSCLADILSGLQRHLARYTEDGVDIQAQTEQLQEVLYLMTTILDKILTDVYRNGAIEPEVDRHALVQALDLLDRSFDA